MNVTDEMVEAAVTAALKADILPIEGMDGVRIDDFLTYKPADAVELGVHVGKSEDGTPKWDGLSDIRSMEFDDCNRAILRPVIKAVIESYRALSPTVGTAEERQTPAPETHVTGWKSIDTAPKNKTNVIIAVPTKHQTDFIVGEAYFDPEHHDGGDWWWAGTSWGDYHGGPVSELNYHGPTFWQPLPAPPNATTEGQP